MALTFGGGISIGDGINVGVPYITATAGNTTSVVVQQNTAIASFNSFASVIDGRPPYTYYVSTGTLPPGITIASGNGLVSGTPNTIQSAANVTFSVRDVNNDVATTTSTVSFAVTGIPISAVAGNTTPLSTQQNTAISSFNSFASVSDGTVPYTYYVSSGTLPPGITINSGNGLVSGTPNTVQAAANVTFSVKDVNNVVATTTTTRSFAVTVIPISAVAGNVRTISTQQNSAISSFSSFASVSDGTLPYTYYVSAGTLPPGITLASGNGLVSGTPNTVQSAANVTFSVRDVNNVVAGNTSVTSFEVTVIPISAVAGNTTPLVVQQTSAVSFNAFTSVSNGTPPYTYYVSAGTLPTGITIDSISGAVVGAANVVQAAANVTFSVKDVNNVVAATTTTRSIEVTVIPITATAGNTTPLSLFQNTIISNFNAFTSVNNGTTPYTYYVSAGTLPTGIIINSGTGEISGTPTVVQAAANVTFSVKDVNNVVASTTTTRSFAVTSASSPYSIQYFVLAGGGGGGGSCFVGYGAGGGGAGGVLQGSATVSPGTPYTINVGAGGAGGSNPVSPTSAGGSGLGQGTSGQPSNITGAGFTTITTPGGGGGGGGGINGPGVRGLTGGSAGGAGQPFYPSFTGTAVLSTGSPGAGVAGTYGYPGGAGGASSSGSGGGAGGSGFQRVPAGSPSGAGASWPYQGTTYASGGGWGGFPLGSVAPGGGGLGGVPTSPYNGSAGSPGTGGGGGGGGRSPGPGTPTTRGTGGQGGGGRIMIAVPNVAYPTVSAPGAAVSNPASAPGLTVLTWTTSSTFTA